MNYPRIQAVGIDDERKLFSTNDGLLGAIFLIPNNKSQVQVLEVSQGTHQWSMPLEELKKIILEAKANFASPVVLLHKTKLPSGKDFRFSREDIELLELIMSVSTKQQLILELKKRKKTL